MHLLFNVNKSKFVQVNSSWDRVYLSSEPIRNRRKVSREPWKALKIQRESWHQEGREEFLCQQILLDDCPIRTNLTSRWEGCGETRTLIYCRWEWEMVHPLLKKIWQFFKVQDAPFLWPSNCTPRYLPKKNESACSDKDLYWNILSTCIHNRQKLETA